MSDTPKVGSAIITQCVNWYHLPDDVTIDEILNQVENGTFEDWAKHGDVIWDRVQIVEHGGTGVVLHDTAPEHGFSCAACGKGQDVETTFVVTTLDYDNPRGTRTEMCVEHWLFENLASLPIFNKFEVHFFDSSEMHELCCNACGERLCHIEDDDPMFALIGMMTGHTCPDPENMKPTMGWQDCRFEFEGFDAAGSVYACTIHHDGPGSNQVFGMDVNCENATYAHEEDK